MIPKIVENEAELDKYATKCLVKYGVPVDIVLALYRYVNFKIPEGGFMTAVLSNDLIDSCARADGVNKHRISNIVDFCWSEIPSICWGSEERVNQWLMK